MTPLPDRLLPHGRHPRPRSLPRLVLPACRGPLDLDFAPTPASLKSLTGRVNSLWRYAETPPPRRPHHLPRARAAPRSSSSRTASAAKLDFLMPTLSFKDRGAVLLAELALRLGPRPGDRRQQRQRGHGGRRVLRPRRPPLHGVRPRAGTSAKKLEQIGAHGAQLHLVARRPRGHRRERPARPPTRPAPSTPRHVYNPYFLHGTKTYVHELWEDLGRPAPRGDRRPRRQRHPAAGRGPRRRRTARGGAHRPAPRPRTPSRPPRSPRWPHAWAEGADDLIGSAPPPRPHPRRGHRDPATRRGPARSSGPYATPAARSSR